MAIEIFTEIATVLIVASIGIMIGLAAIVGTYSFNLGVPLSFGFALAGMCALMACSSKLCGVSASTVVVPAIEGLGLLAVIVLNKFVYECER